MSSLKLQIIVAALVLLIALLPQSVYTVNMMEKAVQLRFQKVQRSNFEPGLYFKVPFIDQVIKFDKRTLTWDAEPERFITKEKKFLIVDSFAQKVNSGLRDEFGVRTIREVVSGERREVMSILKEQANTAAKDLGVEIVDVRIKKVDLPEAVSDAVYNRMISERTRVAKQLR